MSEETNPLGLDAAAFVPQEATDAFERAEIVVSCVLAPGKGADRRCSLIVSTEPPTDIPHRNLSLLPHSAACTLAEMPQVVAGLVKEEQSAFGEAWVKAWTEQQKMKAKAKPRAAAASPAKVAITKPPLLDEDAEATEAGDEDEAQPEEEIDEPEDQADDEEPEEVEVPQQAAPATPPAAPSPAPRKATPHPEPAPTSAQMPLLGGIDL